MRKALESIGLTEGECQVYEALVCLGVSRTGSIVKKASISSSKVYEVLQRLMQKGLVSFIIKNGVRYYDATPPERLLDFLEEKRAEITASEMLVKKTIPEIRLKRDSDEHASTIVYTGKQGPKIVLHEILEAGKKGLPNFGFGTDADPYVEHFPQVLTQFIKEASKYKFKTRLIFAKGFTSPNIKAEIRYLPMEYFPPVRTMMYGNKVAIINFSKPITTIIMESAEIADSYKKHFAVLWKIARKK